MVQSLVPEVPPKNGESVHYSIRRLTQAFKRLRTRRYTKPKEADNITRQLSTLPKGWREPIIFHDWQQKTYFE